MAGRRLAGQNLAALSPRADHRTWSGHLRCPLRSLSWSCRRLGGEGPALARPFLNYARDDETLVSVVLNGIPGTGMPPASWLSVFEARQVAAYVKTLGQNTVVQIPPGDPIRGETIYRGKGDCGVCHGADATGNQFGPDLTTLKTRRSPAFVREAIINPGAALPHGLNGVMAFGFSEYLPVTIKRSPNDTSIRGHRINESSFTILIRDQEGTLHSFDKTQLADLTKQFGRSLMPSYARRLTDDEVNDLVAYFFRMGEVIP